MIWSNGDSYEGEWSNDVMDGIGYYTLASGETKKVRFRKGIIENF